MILSLKKYRYHTDHPNVYYFILYFKRFYSGVIALFDDTERRYSSWGKRLAVDSKKNTKKTQTFFLNSLLLYSGVVLIGSHFFMLTKLWSLFRCF